jgi:hypothetical protein
MSDLKHDTVGKLSRHFNRWGYWSGKNISPEKMIRAFLETKIRSWLPIIKHVFITQGCGITVAGNTIVVYGSKEPVELCFSNKELGQQLQHYFDNWLNKSLGECE